MGEGRERGVWYNDPMDDENLIAIADGLEVDAVQLIQAAARLRSQASLLRLIARNPGREDVR